jgi:hypothetical protein
MYKNRDSCAERVQPSVDVLCRGGGVFVLLQLLSSYGLYALKSGFVAQIICSYGLYFKILILSAYIRKCSLYP